MQEDDVPEQSKFVTEYKQIVALSVSSFKTNYCILTTSNLANRLNFLKLFPADIQRILLDLVGKANSVKKAIANVRSLACTCRCYWQIFTDEQMTLRIIQKFEPQLEQEFRITNPNDNLLYWRLFTLAHYLKTRAAFEYFINRSDHRRILDNRNLMSSDQCNGLRRAFIIGAGGLTVRECRVLDRQPVKVRDERLPDEPQYPFPVKVLPLQTRSLRSLAGLDHVPDVISAELLKVSGNNLSRIHPEEINRLTNLTRIDCGNNAIQTVNLDAFAHLPRLRSLDFHANKIQEITGHQQFQSTEIETLSFNTNRIRNFDVGITMRVPARLIDLRGNPLENADELRALSKVKNRILVGG